VTSTWTVFGISLHGIPNSSNLLFADIQDKDPTQLRHLFNNKRNSVLGYLLCLQKVEMLHGYECWLVHYDIWVDFWRDIFRMWLITCSTEKNSVILSLLEYEVRCYVDYFQFKGLQLIPLKLFSSNDLLGYVCRGNFVNMFKRR
jgi:hypothetical protein